MRRGVAAMTVSMTTEVAMTASTTTEVAGERFVAPGHDAGADPMSLIDRLPEVSVPVGCSYPASTCVSREPIPLMSGCWPMPPDR